MTAWYKEPNYDGSGITKQIDLKKGAGAMVGPIADFANQSGITEGLKPTGKALGGAVNRITEPVATGISEGIKYSPIGVGGNAQRIISNPRSMLPKGMGKKMAKAQGGYDDKNPIQQDVIPPLKPKVPKKLGGYTGFNKPGGRSLPTDAMTVTNKSLVKSINRLLKNLDEDYEAHQGDIGSGDAGIQSSNLRGGQPVGHSRKAPKRLGSDEQWGKGSFDEDVPSPKVGASANDYGISLSLKKSRAGQVARTENIPIKQVRRMKRDVEQRRPKGSPKSWYNQAKRNPDKAKELSWEEPTTKSLVKSIDTFLMRKGIIQKTANKSSLPLGEYQKAGEPVKRMVNNSATLQSPDVWSAGKKTTKTKD